ncbi:MAG: Type III restriction-modification enzyme helicase subunit, partial [Candidatus Woesebacteria bacterium GW2011_GWA1_38_8]
MDIVKHLSNELSLRVPQRLSLVNLDSQLSRVDLFKDSSQEIEAKIGAIKFDTKFPSLCYALATGVGKTKLMGAMMLYLYQKKGLRNFFILTPGETIYTKTKANFTRGNE